MCLPGLLRLDQAERDAALTGYHEPEDPGEKRWLAKRFCSGTRLSVAELSVLMREVLGSPSDMIRQAGQMWASSTTPECAWHLRRIRRPVELFLHRTYPLTLGCVVK